MSTEQWITVWSSFGSAIIGGLIGGGFAILAGRQAHKNSLKLDQVQGQKKIDGILQAIRCELVILGEVYQQQAGGMLEKLKEGEPFDVNFSLTEKYFIVYPNNTDVVGQIEDTDLVKAIVVTYNKANFLIEMFRINNWYLDQLRGLSEVHNQTLQEGSQLIIRTNIAALEKRRIEHAGLLKQVHADLDRETASLLKKIDDYRQRHPVKMA
jgi:hypothetical protein